MKCKVCGGNAVISLRAYNSALCAKDFVSFLENRVLKTIKKYGLIEDKDKLLVAVSGGKDSLSLWHILNKLGFNADGMYIDLGIEGYSDLSLEKVKKMSDVLKRPVYIFHLRDALGKGIEVISKRIKRTTCSACGMIKRYIMNRVCLDKGFNVIVTGHNLDDETSALMGNLLYWKEEYLWKKEMVLDEEEGHLSKKIKPLFLCSEREMAAYAVLCGIDYVYDECPFSIGAKSLFYKEMLNKVEDKSPGTKLQFLKGYLKFTREIKKEKNLKEMRYCINCGYPTLSEICNFCRIMEKYGIKGNIIFDEYRPKDEEFQHR
ncbi:MAG TPA: TIGR00269 family protein [Syntrophorhabdaceae bacterium]|nr:TIGR00269 family protein [Syntrophorhabdaceae bacterium]HPP06269.1 TIGR00269 family protein [Syntrophorhabdaceae bacterium]